MYKLLLSWRYLRTRYIALASITSVTLGVATLIVVNSVMAGFKREMHQRLHGILEALELRGLLDAVVLPAECGAAKPDPAAFHHALARLGVEPGEALHVGDDPGEDLCGARAAGIEAVDVGGLATLGELWGRVAPDSGGPA